MKFVSRKSFLSFEYKVYKETLNNINQHRENGYKRIQMLATISLAECGALFWLVEKTFDKFPKNNFPWYIISILTIEMIIVLLMVKLSYDGLCNYKNCEIDPQALCDYLNKQHEKIDDFSNEVLISDAKTVLIDNYRREIVEADNELSKHNQILYNMYKICFGNLILLLLFFALLKI